MSVIDANKKSIEKLIYKMWLLVPSYGTKPNLEAHVTSHG